MSVEPIAPYLEPLRKSVRVARPPAEVFSIFTAGIGRWWPLASHSLSRSRAVSCGIEPRVGGDVYELRDDGERYVWGSVLVWEPPARLVLRWHPGREPETAQEVELRFRAEGGGTVVELEHRGWASLGDKAREVREGYDQGWEVVLVQRFAAGAASGQ